jgi:hypothetical protein
MIYSSIERLLKALVTNDDAVVCHQIAKEMRIENEFSKVNALYTENDFIWDDAYLKVALNREQKMDEAPSWAPAARRYEIVEALGIDPWAGRSLHWLKIHIYDDRVEIDIMNAINITYKNLQRLSTILLTTNIQIECRHDGDGEPSTFNIIAWK